MTAELIDRIATKFTVGDGCWEWTAAKTTGYGRVSGEAGGQLSAHRVLYEMLVGPVPDGLVLDHLCRNRACVRPDHLEPVTQGENVRRYTRTITHCPQGHEYTPENTKLQKGCRYCAVCTRERAFRRYHRLKATR